MNTSTMWTTVVLTILFIVAGNAQQCVPRSFGADRIVCVCNATYCDGLPADWSHVPTDGSVYWYTSNKKGVRLSISNPTFGTGSESDSCVALNVNRTQQYQSIQGFGGTFTDSVGVNLRKLSQGAQERLIRSYYDPKTGSGYNIGRIAIGSCDFSTRIYSYDDVANDTTLSHFSLTMEDRDYKLPYARMALQLNPKTKFIGSAWTVPPWMKTNNEVNGNGFDRGSSFGRNEVWLTCTTTASLKRNLLYTEELFKIMTFTTYFKLIEIGFLREEYYQLYADYLLRFIEEYHKQGIHMTAITTGSEPSNFLIPYSIFSNLGWTPSTLATWVANNLGPTLAASEYNRTQIIALDDQRWYLPWFMLQMFNNTKARDYISGIAVHWYGDQVTSPELLDRTHDAFPDKYLVMSEASTGFLRFPAVDLGSWERGEAYVLSIIEYMNHWTVIWVDFNLALDKNGGPTWISNFSDSPIIVNPETDEFYKQPMYYALKHFSRFIGSGSIRISISDTESVKSVAFLTPTNDVTVVLYNRENVPQCVTLNDPERGTLSLNLTPNSINTLTYKQ